MRVQTMVQTMPRVIMPVSFKPVSFKPTSSNLAQRTRQTACHLPPCCVRL